VVDREHDDDGPSWTLTGMAMAEEGIRGLGGKGRFAFDVGTGQPMGGAWVYGQRGGGSRARPGGPAGGPLRHRARHRLRVLLADTVPSILAALRRGSRTVRPRLGDYETWRRRRSGLKGVDDCWPADRLSPEFTLPALWPAA